jgi:hypothetical protein
MRTLAEECSVNTIDFVTCVGSEFCVQILQQLMIDLDYLAAFTANQVVVIMTGDFIDHPPAAYMCGQYQILLG